MGYATRVWDYAARRRRLATAVAAVALICLVVFVPDLPKPDPGLQAGNLSDSSKAAITVLVETNKFVISLALIMIGAIAALLFKRDMEFREHALSMTLAVAACVCAMLSVYYGYNLYIFLINQLGNKLFKLDPKLVAQLNSQRLWFLLSAGIFVLLVLEQALWRPDPK